MNRTPVTVVGAGFAGCEAAWALARYGIPVILREMKPQKFSPAHHSPGFAELICSNSFKAQRLESAAGLLKAEMERLGSLCVPCAKATAVAAGGALAVDRVRFSDLVTERIRSHPLITVIEGEVTQIPDGEVILATGPLTSEALSEAIGRLISTEYLSFFDAAAPIVEASSIDMEKVFFAARYGRGDADYINCPFDKEGYERFAAELAAAETVELKDFEREQFKVYEGCMPIEVMARRGADTMRFGPLKPVGLRDPRTGHRPWAAVQLRREDAGGTLYNLVGFQTNLKFPEQKRVFSMIPGLEQAVFARYGVMHRNTFLNSPKLLNADFSLRQDPRIFFADQITGVEGYMESASSGLIAGIALARRRLGLAPLELPATTMLGALTRHVSAAVTEDFQPMGSNMGILPPLPEPVKGKSERYAALSARALSDLETTLSRLEDF